MFPWYVLLLIGAAIALGGRQYFYGTLANKPRETCSWCRMASGHEVAGHTYETCRGLVRERQAEEQRAADRKFAADRRAEHQQNQQNELDQSRARQKGRMRLLQVGTVTTRTGPTGYVIDISGWMFDAATAASGQRPSGSPATFRTTGAPENVHGWTLPELHAMAHGGACTCDVVRLSRNTRH
ncbi:MULTISPECIES: hypothetical protein [unclassified Streptomyces]|uniref:hypothetical protein n=1 Tax=unclassified Streptomyces TaxID=2593676 RepID=UPI001BE80F07|nr:MULTISPECIES: hypothetical protein [unclassified Streptomyces]MBT2406854.1 hypothetical protein [Streptomyces sp. ISL-21]MBT2612969.1 hypothetical protein [Streptomyces sp. ISL-87]